MKPISLALLAALAGSGSCALLDGELATEPVPLADMEEPTALLQEPDDEARRLALPPGAFSGVAVEDARDTLASLMGEPQGVRVSAVVENSPGAAAGLAVGDLLLEFDVGGERIPLRWPAEWRALELEHPAGTRVRLIYERDGAELPGELVLERRMASAPRPPVLRYREELRVGIVLRTATEHEARAAGLAPGAGAVVTGLSRRSPWRAAGVEPGDLLVAVAGRPVSDPRVVLEAIEGAEADERLALELRRGAELHALGVRVSRREQDLQRVSIPLLLGYEREPGRCRLSLLLGLLRYTSTPAAWRLRLLWLFVVGGGDSDRLVEVDH